MRMRLTAVRAFPVAAVALLALVGAPSANACNCPSLMVVGPALKAQAGSGDQVTYTLTNLTDGAEYSINVEGHEVVPTTIAHGTYAKATFSMPDLGTSDRPVTVQAVVNHADLVTEGCEQKPYANA